MQIHLKKGEKLYVNGAVIRAEHRCSIEFLNNVTFLLENHVMQAEKAVTPLKQIYFVVQSMLIDPDNAQMTRELYWHLSGCLRDTLQNTQLIAGLASSDASIKSQRYFDALKTLRGLFEIEAGLLSAGPTGQILENLQKEVA
jgi:flagellar biosynthesis repressor protein FlbT